jgi:hypothetical protein
MVRREHARPVGKSELKKQLAIYCPLFVLGITLHQGLIMLYRYNFLITWHGHGSRVGGA